MKQTYISVLDTCLGGVGHGIVASLGREVTIQPTEIGWEVDTHAPSHTHSNSPGVFNGTFGKESLSGLVMGSSGASAILKLLHQHRGEGRITKRVDTGESRRQQRNWGKEKSIGRRKAKINVSFPWTNVLNLASI